MPKVVYGMISLLVAGITLWIAKKCSKKKETMAGATTKVCLAGAFIMLFNAVAMFSDDSMVMSLSYSCLYVCIDLFLFALLDYTVQLAEFGRLKPVYKISIGAMVSIDAVVLLSNPWTNIAVEFNQIVSGGNLYLEHVPKLWYSMHRIFAYFLLVSAMVVLIVKCIKIPLVYAGQYLLELTLLFAGAILNLVLPNTVIQVGLFSLLYSVLAFAVYGIALEYSPRFTRIQARYLVMNKMQEPFVLFDLNGQLIDFNKEAEEKFDLKKNHLYSMTKERFEEEVLNLDVQENSPAAKEEITITKDYAEFIFKCKMTKLTSESGKYMGDLYVFHDITKQKTMYSALERASMYNATTGFYVGKFFFQKIEELDRERKTMAVAVCNLAGLELINQICGRRTGDKVIGVMADALREILPQDALIGNLDDDNTMLVVPDITEEQLNLYLATVARKVKQRALEHVPVFMFYGVSYRKNPSVSSVEYLKYARMEMIIKKGKEGREYRRLMTEALLKEYYENKYESSEHVERIKALSKTMAEKLGLSEEEKYKLEKFCCYHDIGKIKTKEEIWNRTEGITDGERDIIKIHPIEGYLIAKQMELGCDISDLVLCHHENFDGSGYPYALSGEEIPLLVRILNIVDSYDVMVHDQSYKDAVSEEAALRELHANAGVQFDPALITIFEECLNECK